MLELLETVVLEEMEIQAAPAVVVVAAAALLASHPAIVPETQEAQEQDQLMEVVVAADGTVVLAAVAIQVQVDLAIPVVQEIPDHLEMLVQQDHLQQH